MIDNLINNLIFVLILSLFIIICKWLLMTRNDNVTSRGNLIELIINFHRNTRGCSFSSIYKTGMSTSKTSMLLHRKLKNCWSKTIWKIFQEWKCILFNPFFLFGILTGNKERNEIACAVRSVATWIINTSQVNPVH